MAFGRSPRRGKTLVSNGVAEVTPYTHMYTHLSCTVLLEHIGLVVRMSIWDTKGRRFEPQRQYIFSLSKRLYPHCFSRLSCEISTRWGQPRDGN